MSQDLFLQFEDVEAALHALLKDVDACEAAGKQAGWVVDDQTTGKWGSEPAASHFSSSYQQWLTQLRKKIEAHQKDVETMIARVREAQERLNDASESERDAINRMLVEEWAQSSTPVSSDTTDSTPGVGFGVPQVGPA